MKGRLALVLSITGLLAAGTLAAQQPPPKPPAKPAPTATQPAAPTQPPASQVAAKPAAPKWTTEQIKEAQEGLKRAKVYTGPINGVLGAATRRAIRTFQREHKMTVNGELSAELLTTLKEVK